MLSSEFPEGYKFDFQEYLFNTERHRLTQAKEGWKSFYWLDEKKKLVKASFHVHIDGNMAKSPFRATFGGIDFSSKLSFRQLSEYLRLVDNELERLSLEHIEIKMAPQNYGNTKFTFLFQALSDINYSVLYSQIVSSWKVDNSHFSDLINSTKRQSLIKQRVYINL
jgi:hypothetical protein